MNIFQERFLLKRSKESNDTNDYKWWVPITYATRRNADFDATVPKIWMKPNEKTKMISGLPQNNDWVIFNVQQTGYYRVNYDDRNWEAIIDQLLQNHLAIPTINRAQIIDDSLSLARAGTSNIVFYLLHESI